MEVLSTHLMETVKSQMPALLTLGSMQRLMQELRSLSDEARAQAYQRVFDSMVPDKVAPEHLLSVLRLLLEDRISIRNLALIVEAVHESRSPDPEAAAEFVRRRLRGQITEALTDPEGQLDVLQLHPGWEAEFLRAEAEPGRTAGAVTPPLMQRLTEKLRLAAAGLPPETQPALVVPDHRRRLVRAVAAGAGLSWPILGIDEVDPQARIRLVGSVEP